MNMSIIADSLISGIIQGATELLPVSSTGHLLLFSYITGTSLALSEIAVLHLGTLGSILIAMREKLRSFTSLTFLVKIAIAIIPAGIIGFLFEEYIDNALGSSWNIALSLTIWGIVMIATDKMSGRKKYNTDSLEKISFTQALIVGAAQILALIPGTSRSGITTLAGIHSGMSPEIALSFSFISGIPLLAASGIYGVIKMLDGGTNVSSPQMIIMATVVSAIVGFFAAELLKKRITKGILTICGIYRIVLGIMIAAILLF